MSGVERFKVIYPYDFNNETNELKFFIKNDNYNYLFNIIDIHSNICPESGILIIDEKPISKFKHIESKDSMHTFEMWESPDLLPCILLHKSSIFLQFNFSINSSMTLIHAKIYYQNEPDSLFKFVPFETPEIYVDLKDGIFDVVTNE